MRVTHQGCRRNTLHYECDVKVSIVEDSGWIALHML